MLSPSPLRALLASILLLLMTAGTTRAYVCLTETTSCAANRASQSCAASTSFGTCTLKFFMSMAGSVIVEVNGDPTKLFTMNAECAGTTAAVACAFYYCNAWPCPNPSATNPCLDDWCMHCVDNCNNGYCSPSGGGVQYLVNSTEECALYAQPTAVIQACYKASAMSSTCTPLVLGGNSSYYTIAQSTNGDFFKVIDARLYLFSQSSHRSKVAT